MDINAVAASRASAAATSAPY